MKLRIVLAIIVSTLWVTGCSNSSNNSNDSSQTPPVLTILVTNDDGIGAPGINALVNQLIELDNVDVRVVAPAENQSGSSDKTTDGELVWIDSATSGGYAGIAVFGFPADAVNVALEQLDIVPGLVVSGVNSGQNVGPLAPLSGTVGAAQTGARAGYPAIAASAGQDQQRRNRNQLQRATVHRRHYARTRRGTTCRFDSRGSQCVLHRLCRGAGQRPR